MAPFARTRRWIKATDRKMIRYFEKRRAKKKAALKGKSRWYHAGQGTGDVLSLFSSRFRNQRQGPKPEIRRDSGWYQLGHGIGNIRAAFSKKFRDSRVAPEKTLRHPSPRPTPRVKDIQSLSPRQLARLAQAREMRDTRVSERLAHRLRSGRISQGEFLRRFARVLRDREHRPKYIAGLKRAAERDPTFSTLYNRSAFRERAKEDFFDQNKPSSMVYIDLDNFKSMNEVLGHHVADVVLHFVSRRLNEESRARNGWAGRWGGEELVAVVPGTREEGVQFVRDLRRRLDLEWKEMFGKDPLLIDLIKRRNLEFTFSFSAGLSHLSENPESYEAWERLAEQNTNRAKGRGKDRYVYRDEYGRVRYERFDSRQPE